MNRNCKKCLINKPIEDFYKHTCGYQHTCKECSKKNANAWIKNNPERRLEIVKKSRSKPENAWKSYFNEYKKRSGDTAKRRAQKDMRTPSWLSEEDFWLIKEIYDFCALRNKITKITWHVDHIFPLRGKTVSGLHVPQNLQIITKQANLLKGSKLLT